MQLRSQTPSNRSGLLRDGRPKSTKNAFQIRKSQKYVNIDPESLYDHKNEKNIYNKLIFSMALLPQEVYSDDTTKISKGLQLIITDVCSKIDNNLQEQLKRKTDPTKLNYKKFDVKFVTFKQALIEAGNFLNKHGGRWVSHSFTNDEELFIQTDNFLGGNLLKHGLCDNFADRFKLKEMRDLYKSMHFIDIRSVVQNRTDKSMKWMQEFQAKENIDMKKKFSPQRLEFFVQAVRNKKDYNQPHTSDGDVLAQAEVIAFIVKLDGWQVMPTTTYILPYKFHETLKPVEKPVEQSFENDDCLVGFGKHSDKTYKYVFDNDPSYCDMFSKLQPFNDAGKRLQNYIQLRTA